MTETTITINSFVVTIRCHGNGQGGITITDPVHGKFETWWGAMGKNTKEFLLVIDEDYFTNRLLGPISSQTYDNKKTFAELRRYIREDIVLPWYKHKSFQRNLR